MMALRRFLAFLGVLILVLFGCKKATEPVSPGWEVLSIGSNVDLLGVDFVDENYGWVIGRDTVVYHTTDGGNSWIRQSYPQYQVFFTELIDIHFINRQLGWAVGDYGTIYKTIDGGQNWIIKESLSTTNFRCIIFADPRHGWICAGAGGISYLTTTDGGETWIPVYSDPYQIVLWDFVDSLNGWARINSAINKTSDGGISWVNISPGPIPSGSFDFVDLYNGWGLITQRVSEYERWQWIIHTADGGYSWEVQSDTFKSQMNSLFLYPLKMFNSKSGWIGKYEPPIVSVLHTTNGGVRWIDQLLPPVGDRPILDIDFVNENMGWAVGFKGLLLRTKSAGNPIR